jgi:hypothetical protein
MASVHFVHLFRIARQNQRLGKAGLETRAGAPDAGLRRIGGISRSCSSNPLDAAASPAISLPSPLAP